MSKFLTILLFSAVLTGCGSDSGSSSNNSSASFSVNGLFLNDDGSTSLIVDTDNGIVNILDSSETLYNIDSVDYSSGTVVTLTGITEITGNSWISLPEEQATLTYSSDGETVTFNYAYSYTSDGTTYSGTVTETFNKQADSLAVTDFSGSHMSSIDASTEWIINDDNSVTVNAFCTFSGTLTESDFYYDIALTATGCDSGYSDYENAEFTGRAYTVEYQGVDNFVAFAINDTENIVTWDVVPLD